LQVETPGGGAGIHLSHGQPAGSMQIGNSGTGTLQWVAPPDDASPWLTVSPASGSLAAGAQQSVQVVANVSLLPGKGSAAVDGIVMVVAQPGGSAKVAVHFDPQP
jgi:hypothetical protein